MATVSRISCSSRRYSRTWSGPGDAAAAGGQNTVVNLRLAALRSCRRRWSRLVPSWPRFVVCGVELEQAVGGRRLSFPAVTAAAVPPLAAA